MPGAPLELIAVEVRADIDQLQRQMPQAKRIVDQSADGMARSMVQAERQVAVSSTRIGNSFNSAAQRSRLLGYQISDIGTQLASGQSPFLILAQQGPQVANALEGVSGVAGRLAAFFSGPWGAALLAATTIAGGLIAKLWDTKDAADAAAESTQRLAAALSNLRNLNFTNQDIFTVAREAERLRVEANRLEGRAAQGRGAPGASGRFFEQEAERLRQEARELGSQLGSSLAQRQVFGNIRSTIQQAVDFANAQAGPGGGSRSRGGGRSGSAASSAAARDAQREAEAREREAVALEERFATTRDQLELERRLAELRDRGTEEAKKQADIIEAHYRLESQFPQLAESVNQADQARLQVLKDIATATIEEAYGRKAARDELEAWFEAAEKGQREVAQAREQAEREAQQMQEARIRTLAGLYYDAFNGGTEAIWDNFKSMGLAVIAEVLARWTAAQLGGESFSLGGAIGAAVSSVLPGFASGGAMRIGGRGGTDANLLSLNNRPIAKVSAGEVLNVTNPTLPRGGSQPLEVTVKVEANDYFDARVASVSRQVATPIAQQTAAQIGAAVGRGVLKAMPSRMAQFSRDGT